MKYTYMDTQSEIITLKNDSTFKFKEKGSIFIGFATTISSSKEAESILKRFRKKYYDATHNCYAFNFINDGEKYSDDGEPNGTAGIRILNAIQHFNVSNTICIVTRFFGGTKLGVGPLGKAYYQSAFETYKAAELIKKQKHIHVQIKFSYEFSSLVHRQLSKFNAMNIENKFEEIPSVEFYLKPDYFQKLSNHLTDSSGGKILISMTDKTNYIQI